MLSFPKKQTGISPVPSRYCLVASLAFWFLVTGLHAFADGSVSSPTTVGIPQRLEGLVLAGSELEAIPSADRKNAVLLQVLKVYPHGALFRYDIEYTGLEPGSHDLRKYLRRKDGTALGDLPPIQVDVKPVLPPGQVKPNELVLEKGPIVGGYGLLAGILAASWLAGLIALIWSFLPGMKKVRQRETGRPPSLAEKIRPLVEGAVKGSLSRSELAGLERGLLAWWRKRLGLEKMDPSAALERLRQHPEAGPLLVRLEAWLHQPESSGDVDVQALLKPYLNLPADDLDTTGGGA